MWEKGKMLAACMFALAWWSIFYPELCFAEGTFETMQTAETEETNGQTVILQGQEADETGRSAAAQSAHPDQTSGFLRAKDDEVVISSRLLEWCEERLSAKKE